ncbi:uncharacterized protein [Amphiura filiformis]|uniref:uncharacterized protein n=1 Tax=Amphiura filiformis TaxID=82378 RepID=UPI003B224227
MVKYCCHGFCRSNNRNVESREDMQGVAFISFPKPKNNMDKCARWILACGREDITLDRVKSNTYVCSKHFVGRNGPTDIFPDPLPVCEEDFAAEMASKRKSRKHVCRPLELANKLFGQYGEQILMGKISCSSLGLLQLGDEEEHQGTSTCTYSEPLVNYDQQDPDDENPHVTIKTEPIDEELPSNHQSISAAEMDATGFYDMQPSTVDSSLLQNEEGSELPSLQDDSTNSRPQSAVSSAVSNTTNSDDLQLNISIPVGQKLSQSPSAVRSRRCRQKKLENPEMYEKMKKADRERKRKSCKNLTEEQMLQSRADTTAKEDDENLHITIKTEPIDEDEGKFIYNIAVSLDSNAGLKILIIMRAVFEHIEKKVVDVYDS